MSVVRKMELGKNIPSKMKSIGALSFMFGGTFVPDNHGCNTKGMVAALTTEESAEEDERVAGRRRYIDVEDL
jgi:hypothetical protein